MYYGGCGNGELNSSRTIHLAKTVACVASVPVRGERNQAARSAARKCFSHSGRAKIGAKAKRWKEGGGGGERRELLAS